MNLLDELLAPFAAGDSHGWPTSTSAKAANPAKSENPCGLQPDFSTCEALRIAAKEATDSQLFAGVRNSGSATPNEHPCGFSQVSQDSQGLDHISYSGASVEAWIERRLVLFHQKASPSTLTKFALASAALDRQIADAGAQQDSDASCWPHSSAMNTVEIKRFTSRVTLFMRQGLDATKADDLADKLVIRDREGDDRLCCAECRHAKAKDGTCPGGHPLPLQLVHRCIHVRTA